MQAPGKNFFVFANPAAAPFPSPPPAGERQEKRRLPLPFRGEKIKYLCGIFTFFPAPCNASFTSA